MYKIVLAVAALALAFAPSVRANVAGSQGFSSPTLDSADANPTGNINTAVVFLLDDWSTTSNSTGIFTKLPGVQDFGNVTLTLGPARRLIFGNTGFGTFNSQFISASSTGPGFLDVLAQGTWEPGTIFPGSPLAMSEVRIALTQTPPLDGSISASGTMSITSVVPENSTFILFATGLLAALLVVPRLRGKLV